MKITFRFSEMWPKYILSCPFWRRSLPSWSERRKQGRLRTTRSRLSSKATNNMWKKGKENILLRTFSFVSILVFCLSFTAAAIEAARSVAIKKAVPATTAVTFIICNSSSVIICNNSSSSIACSKEVTATVAETAATVATTTVATTT